MRGPSQPHSINHVGPAHSVGPLSPREATTYIHTTGPGDTCRPRPFPPVGPCTLLRLFSFARFREVTYTGQPRETKTRAPVRLSTGSIVHMRLLLHSCPITSQSYIYPALHTRVAWGSTRVGNNIIAAYIYTTCRARTSRTGQTAIRTIIDAERWPRRNVRWSIVAA